MEITMDINTNFNPSDVGPRRDVASLVPEDVNHILDIGCSIGALGAAIKQKQKASIVGIDKNVFMADLAKSTLDEVIIADLNITSLRNALGEKHLRGFDCIIFSDILEHLIDPWATLKEASLYLNSKGIIIASIPNIRHWETFYHLLRGRWPYQERGIYNIGHLRVFTLSNIQEMFDKAGFALTTVRRNLRLVEKPRPINRHARYLNISFLREFFTFQYLVVAQRKN